jgi:hypothetical protein
VSRGVRPRSGPPGRMGSPCFPSPVTEKFDQENEGKKSKRGVTR